MQHRRDLSKNIFSIVLFFVYIIVWIINPINTVNADNGAFNNAAEFQWIDGNMIISYQEGAQTYTLAKLGDKGVSLIKKYHYQLGSSTMDAANYDFYIGDKPGVGGSGGISFPRHSEVYYISVHKKKTVSYQYIVDVFDQGQRGVDYPYARKITINDPNNKAPSAAKEIYIGELKGMVYQFEPKAWKATNFNENVVDQQVKLTNEAGDEMMLSEDLRSLGLPGGWSVIRPDHSWTPYKLSSPNSVLYEGRYNIEFQAEEGGSCSDGNAQSFLNALCTITLSGKVTFDLSPLPDGSGKITLINNDPFEQASLINGKSTKDLVMLGAKEGLRMNIEYKLSSPLDGIMEQAMGAVLNGIKEGIKLFGGWVNGMLNYGNDINNNALGAVWSRVRNLSLGLLTLGILIIAFANILNIDLEKYGLNRMIPKLVIALVATYFSFLIVRFLLEIASALQNLALGGTTLDVANLGGGKFSSAFSGDIGSMINSMGLLIVLFFLGFILMVSMLWLCLVLIVRVAVIWFLVALAPLAAIMMIMPFTEGLYQQWWKMFWKWAFMGPAIAFMLYMTNEFLQAGFGTSYMGTSTMQDAGTWIFLAMGAAGIFLSASLPFTMGGDIYGAVQKGLQKYGGHLPGVKQAKARLDLRKSAKESALKLRAQKSQAKLAQLGIPGRILAGTTKNQSRMLDENLVSATGQEHGMTNMKEGEVAGMLTNKNVYVARAAARELASRKRLGKYTTSDNADRVADLIDRDGGLNAAVFKENKDVFASIASHSRNTATKENYTKLARGTIQATALKEMKAHQYKFAQSDEGTRSFIKSKLASAEEMGDYMKTATSDAKAQLGQVLAESADLRDGLGADLVGELTREAAKSLDINGKNPLD